MNTSTSKSENWPELRWEQWKETARKLHMFTQIVGKTRLALTHTQNHWWNVPLYVTARGLTTSAMAMPTGGLLDIEFDFLAQELLLRTSSGRVEHLPLLGQTVATFFAAYLTMLQALGVAVKLDPMPVELKQPVRFDLDTESAVYDGEAALRFWKVLSRADTLFKQFSTNFYGKISPVHFFWGSFDLAVTRFNGQVAPPRPGADGIQAEAYSHACISAGFWPGNGGFGQASFYCYAAPVPDGLSAASLSSRGAFNKDLGEFLLHYEDLRTAANPDQTLLDFLAATYAAAADAAGWDRTSLDRHDAVAAAAIRVR